MNEDILKNPLVQIRYLKLMEAAKNGNLSLTVYFDIERGIYLPMVTEFSPQDLIVAVSKNEVPEFDPLAILLIETPSNLIPPSIKPTEVN